MNIKNLTNHICFSKIFNENKNEDGSYNWIKIANCPNLSLSFIDKYFFQIYHFHKIEKMSNLSEHIINKYAGYLNWSLLLKYQFLSERILEKYFSKYDIKLCLRTQKLTLNFLKNHKDSLKSEYLKDLHLNKNISEEFKNDMENLFF